MQAQLLIITPKAKGSIVMLTKIALALLIIGGINWGLIGILSFDLVAFIFGSQAALLSRIVYTLVGVSALLCIPLMVDQGTGAQ